jgi:spore coat protein U-like protein
VNHLRAGLSACILAACLEARAATCSVSAAGLAFGTYDVSATAPLDVTGTVEFRCNEPSAVKIQFSPGSAGTFWPRTMRNGQALLEYNIYTNGSRSQVWGDGTNGTVTRNLGAGRGEPVAVFGRVPPLQNVPAGAYGDTLIVTFNF